MICTFFGHRDAPDTVRPLLREVLIDLIERQHVTSFYVGNQGRFDAMVRSLLASIAQTHQIEYDVVLAYYPNKPDPLFEAFDTLLPEGIETVPRRFAIDYRNKWMLEQSDFVVTYVTHSFGGAAKFKELAEKKNKVVIELSGLAFGN
jgi:hypothetical protein